MESRINIPKEIKDRLPLMKEEYMALYKNLKEHPHSPIWNYTCGDRLYEEDAVKIEQFKLDLYSKRKFNSIKVPNEIIQWIKNLLPEVILFKENTKGLDIQSDFEKIKCMTREDIASSLEKIVPLHVSLDRLIVNSTSGTTGHPIVIPNHPTAIGYYTPLLLFTLEMHGINPIFTKDNVGCMLICAQKETAVYSTVVPILNGTGFAKINLDKSSWRNTNSSREYINDFSPQILTGDPFSFAELLNLELDYKPKALVSTSMEMSASLRNKLKETFQTKVIDYYSLNETGPIAYSCPDFPEEFHILPFDIYVEIIDKEGFTLPENQRGEITITGGRNPYLPLLRYKTGDRAKMKFGNCSCGDSSPKLYDLEMRKQILFYNLKKELVNPIDITRIMKRYPILQYEFLQENDLSCKLSIRKLHDFSQYDESKMEDEIISLFQNEISLAIDFNLDTNGKKPTPYKSNFTL
jgi:phenylacetate-CoA ligase